MPIIPIMAQQMPTRGDSYQSILALGLTCSKGANKRLVVSVSLSYFQPLSFLP